MKTTIKNFFKIFSFIFILSSCGNKAADVLIPQDAAMVVHINASSLSSKVTWDEIKNSEWFKMVAEDRHNSDKHRKLLENPDSSGIDLKSDMYVFMQMRGPNTYTVLQGKLTDAKAYQKMIVSMDHKEEVKKESGFSYVGNEHGCMTWTDDRFIFVGHSDVFQPRNSMFGKRIEQKITVDSVLKYAKDLYGLKKKNSIASNSRFASILAEKGDVHFWISSNSFMQSGMPAGFNLFKAVSLLEGNAIGYTLNFDNGKITASTKTWYNKEIGALMKKYQPGNLNTEMLKKIQGQNVSAVFAMNYPPEGLKEFLKLFGVDGMINGFIGELGLSIDDFVKANKGDLLFAVSDFSVQDKGMSLPGGNSKDSSLSFPQPEAKILFATSINDKPAFDKMIDVLKSEISKNGGAKDLAMIKYTVKDNWFIAGNAQETIDGYAAGSTTDHPFISKISGHPMGGFIDFQKMTAGINSKKMGLSEKLLTGDGKVWENAIFYGGEMKDGATIAYFEVNMFDKNTNSLKQLNSFMSNVAKETKDRNESDWGRLEKDQVDSMTRKSHPLPN